MPPQERPSTREEVIIALNAKYAVMRRLYGVKKIGLFGSVARGEERAESDVDIEVEFDSGMDTYANYIGLSLYLDELLGRRVDLVLSRVLASYLRPELGAEFAVLSRDKVYSARYLTRSPTSHTAQRVCQPATSRRTRPSSVPWSAAWRS